MASIDDDISSWLYTKLSSTEDLWSTNLVTSQLTRDAIAGTHEILHTLLPIVKLKFIISLTHLSKRQIDEVSALLNTSYYTIDLITKMSFILNIIFI